MFDENGEDDEWTQCGDICIAYSKNNNVISVLTFTVEKQSNLHIYLTYTIPDYRSQGLGSKLFDYVKNFAYKNDIKTITVCTDVSKNNPVPNMFLKNGFKYFKTGYDKILIS